MAKKKQRINLIDRNGNSQVVEVNSTVSETPSKETKKSTISSAIRGGINKAKSDARNYGPLVTVANTVNGLGLGATGSNINKTDSRGHNLLDNALQVGKNVRAGVQSGLMSIPDSQLYELRNSLQKGEKKAEETTNAKDSTKELLKSGGKALLYTLSPTLGQAVDNLSGNREYDEDDNAFQRALKSANNTYNVLGGTRGLGKTVEAAGQLYSENQERQGKNDKLSSKVEKFQETIDKPAEDYAQQVQLENQDYSKPVQFLGNTGQTVGNMIPSMVVSAATKNPNSGLATMFLQSKGSATKEALQKGADLDEANAIGTAKGGIEVGTERLFGGIKLKGKSVYGSGTLDDITETTLNKLIKNKTANFLVKQLGVNNVGEILEETISDIAGTIIDKNTTDPNASYSMKDWGNTALQTLASTLALNLLGGSFGRTSYNENLKSMSDTEIAQMQDALIKTSPEDIQRIVSKEVESINQKVQEGKLNAEQAQLAIETIQSGGQDLIENQVALQNEYARPQNTLESKLEIVQNLNDVEKAKLVEVTQKMNSGQQLDIDDIATLDYLNSKGTPQTTENALISNETTQSATQSATQNVAQNDKNDVLELGETNAKSYGDLGKGRDTNYLNMSNSRRSTGHFGTGTYFVDENYEPGETSSYNKRPVSRANLSDYNLFKPSNENDGLDLHDALKEINYNNTRINDELYNQLNPYYEASFGTTNNLLDEESFNDYKNIRKLLEDAGVETDDFDGSNYSEYERYLEDKITDVLNNYDHNIRAEKDLKRILNITDEQYNNAIEKVKEAQKEYDKHDIDQQVKDDSLSTVFMKALGYEGIDVRHLDRLNNTTYGTVVYDMKNNEKEKNKLNRMQEKININTIKATIAPYYDTPLTKENYNEIKDAVDTTFRETANNLVTLLGGKIKDTTNNIGGFTFSEGENAGNWVKELSYTFELENMSKEDGMLFSSLMGDLAYEQQEAVISSTYENDLNNSNALEFRLKYQDIDKVMDALDKLGIHDYTIDTNNKTLNLLEFDLEKPYDTVQKITDMVQELGGNEADAKFTGIQSEYIDKDVRKGIYETWLKANEGRKENRELYSLVKEAYKKIGGTSDSSFSNENVKVINNKPTITNKEAYNSKPREGTIRLYTNTSAENIDSILKNGLDISKAKQNEYEGNMTWFETRPNLKGYGGTTIAVDVPSNLSMDKVNDTQYTVYDNISPENIVFVDRPVMNNYRTSDIEDLVSKYGEEKVRSVFDRAVESGNNSISKEEFNDLLDSIDKKAVNENIPDKVEEQVIKSNAESNAKQTENEEIKQIENEEIKQIENKDIEQIENREVSKILQEVPKEQRPKINEKLKKWVFNIRQKFTDNQAALYDISREYKNPTLYHKADKILSVDAMAQNNLSKRQTDYHGKVYKNFIDENGNKVSMGFNKAYDMYNEIPNKVKSEFLVNMRNIDQLKNGVDQFQIPLQDSEKLVAEYRKKYKNIDKWGENIWTYGHNQLQNMVDMGMYTQEYADMYLESNPHYIHIDRKMPNNTSPLEQKGRNVTTNNPIKHIKGSTREIMPIKETQAQFTREVYRSMAFNDLAQELAKTIGVSSNDGDINSLDEVYGINQKVLNEENGNYTLTIFNKGVRTTIPINKAIYESLQTRNVPKVPVLADFSNFQRDVLTGKNPYFALSNAAKDAGDMFLYSKHPIYKSLDTYGKLFGGRTIGKAANAVNNKVNSQFNKTTTEQWIELYENRGNLSSSIFQNGEFKKEKGKVAKTITAPITGIEAINNFIESMPRITEFVNTVESYGYTMNSEGELVSKREAFIEKNKGKMSQEELQNKANKIKEPTKSLEKVLLEADYNAAEITTNFKRGGAWAKTMDKNGATFSSAAIQGAAKFGRTFTEAIGDARNGDFRAARRLASRVMTLGVAPALINAIAYKDDDDYEELPDYVKEQYYLFKIKGTNDFIRVPKGRAVSIFESGAKRTIDAVKGKDKAFKGYDTLIMNQIAPNNPFESNVLAPWSAVKNNEAWSGNPIVSDYLEENFNLDKQYDAKTSEFSKWVGNKLKKVDLEDAPVVGAYLEALKTPKKLDYLIDQYSGVIGDILLPSTTNYAENENSSGFNALINPLKSKFKVNSTLTNKATSEYNALKKQIHRDSNDDDATNLVKAKDAYINNDYSDVKSHISSLYAKQREIQNNTKLSDSEKYKQNKQIQRELVDYMNSVMEDLENASEEDGVVSIGNKLYIKGKDSYGNEKMKEFNENKTNAAKEAGLPIKEYAKIDSIISNMEADKDSKGKSISGTKKKKAVQYLKEQGYNEEQIKAIVESYGWKY